MSLYYFRLVDRLNFSGAVNAASPAGVIRYLTLPASIRFSIQPFAISRAMVCWPAGCSCADDSPMSRVHLLQDDALRMLRNVTRPLRHYLLFTLSPSLDKAAAPVDIEEPSKLKASRDAALVT
jgi:hypothetical protein